MYCDEDLLKAQRKEWSTCIKTFWKLLETSPGKNVAVLVTPVVYWIHINLWKLNDSHCDKI